MPKAKRKPKKKKAVYPQVLVIVEDGLVQDVLSDRRIDHGVLDYDALEEAGHVYPESFIRWIERRKLLDADGIADLRELNQRNAEMQARYSKANAKLNKSVVKNLSKKR